MTEIGEFGGLVLFVAGVFAAAIFATKLTEWLPVPAPAIFLLAAAVASDFLPSLSERLSIRDVERIGVVALIAILFEGGMHVGWRRFRVSSVPIASLGVAGTFATAGLMAAAAHYLFGFDWILAGILGAALAPTDPAVMFSVLGRREIAGRTSTILEGESGANDPVGIALMIGLLEFATADHAAFSDILVEISVEMVVGLAIGIAGAALLLPLMRKVSLPTEGLYPLRTLAAAGAIYGVAAIAHGSGFLAVFVAGILVGDARAPFKVEVERFHKALASLAEITVFVALGLTMDLSSLGADHLWLDALILALVLAFIGRPAVVGALLLPVRLRWGERVFVMWGGLKGAVPILLAAFAVLAEVDGADRVYGIVFVVVAFSVIVQGGTIPLAAAKLGIPMRTVEPAPWEVSIRLQEEPHEVHRFVVGAGSEASGAAIRDLPLEEGTWISFVVRGGKPIPARGGDVLEPGDEVVALGRQESSAALRHFFERRV